MDVRWMIDRVSIDFRQMFEDWRSIGGGLEEHWRRIGRLEEDWRRVGGGLEKEGGGGVGFYMPEMSSKDAEEASNMCRKSIERLSKIYRTSIKNLSNIYQKCDRNVKNRRT